MCIKIKKEQTKKFNLSYFLCSLYGPRAKLAVSTSMIFCLCANIYILQAQLDNSQASQINLYQITKNNKTIVQ